ncbi:MULTISPECIES: hypothetical protein [Aeromonas]|uniref:Uncharacterized protein n=1 Tax=Aeromonas veronii TaxID=654 RepID=A0A2T4N803_AERVE|nr:hypothetical protein [Aeromonas veronii]MBA2800410.1 hypothetical protein [Aeromonas veronii]PTH82957.1 hypothetical protein DAA48_00630 [Aeromonas veronii]RDE61283.1 hypothetical protein DV708_16010 [Aeromonas veronii]UJP34080.1 hypothetical protein K3G24_18575 [Aeromonas veronii]
MPYQPYWKSEFQNHLTSMKGKGNLTWWEEVSEELESGGHKIWEYVYRFNLVNPAASIIIFSSVYKATDRSREINSDAVRIVYEWKTRNGLIYSKIAKKYRVDTLFENLEGALINASNDSFDLNKYVWVNSIQETDVQ